MRHNGNRYPSDQAKRCSVCRRVTRNGTFRCETHLTPGKPGPGRDYTAFLVAPIPNGGASHAEIAAVMGITAERVRQIEAVALRKLAHNACAMKLLRELLET